MHKNRNEGGWTALKDKAKRQWDKFNDQAVSGLNVKQHHLDEDFEDTQKNKNKRAEKHLKNGRNIVEIMSGDEAKTIKPFPRK